MKNKISFIKVLVDALMLGMMIILFGHTSKGQVLHEVTGLILVALMIGHIILNQSSTKALFSKSTFEKPSVKTIQAVIDIGMFGTLFFMTISGILTSGFILPRLHTMNVRLWSSIHIALGTAVKIFLIGHVICHIVYLKGYFRKNIGKSILCILICVLMVAAYYMPHIMNGREDKQDNQIVENTKDSISEKDNSATEYEAESKDSQEDTKIESSEIMGSSSERKDIQISFDYKAGGTVASNQYAIWIDDENGNVVRTLFVTSFTIDGGYTFRPDSVPTWVDEADPGSMSNSEIDAISGATPKSGKLSYVWDGKDDNGNQVEDGKYTMHLEATLYWSSIVRFEGDFQLGEEETPEIVLQSEYTEDTKTY